VTLRTASTFAALAATLCLAACGGSDNDSGSPASAKKSADSSYSYDSGAEKTPTPGADSQTGVALTIKAANGMLADAKGRTLYLWEADQGDKSACDGPCAKAWPPLTTDGAPQAGAGVKQGLLGTSKRADGTLGVTYNGHPLYYFSGDQAPGDANGKGSDGFGAEWYPVSPAGAALED
jgi:predicted lipoprotein with Yx(FWY)xxD motif